MVNNKKTTVLIDGNALMHRAYHGINRGFVPMHNGQPVGLLFGFCSSVLKVIEHLKPDRLACCFDLPGKTFRHEMHAEYKGKRQKTPDDFYAQVPLVYDFLEAANIPAYAVPGFESDDVIGSLATHSSAEKVIIVSGDMDFAQLVSDKISLLKWNGKIEKSVTYTPEEVQSRYGVRPDQIIDYKALVGDSSDNYIGVRGIGPKAAEKLLTQFHTLDGIYTELDSVPNTYKNKLKTYKTEAYLAQDLARIFTGKLCTRSIELIDIGKDSIEFFLQKYSFRSLIKRNTDVLRKGKNNNSDLLLPVKFDNKTLF